MRGDVGGESGPAILLGYMRRSRNGALKNSSIATSPNVDVTGTVYEARYYSRPPLRLSCSEGQVEVGRLNTASVLVEEGWYTRPDVTDRKRVS